MIFDYMNMNSQPLRQPNSSIKTVIRSLMGFHGRQVHMRLKEPRFPRRGGGGLDSNVETGVINL